MIYLFLSLEASNACSVEKFENALIFLVLLRLISVILALPFASLFARGLISELCSANVFVQSLHRIV